jgi:hypothetical protein
MAVIINNREVNLSSAQTGNGQSTNIADRMQPETFVQSRGPAMLVITTTIGATPTCTYAVEGSADGSNWWALQYADSATPGTVVTTTFAITTATTKQVIIQPNQPFKQLRITYSANTNVTNTANVYFF